ncbi:hypothetical protein [Marispirochaeta aestuarii]|uniref:hypothetical protein n=1 Tax=Marispirochaeta aestuarii TaxID=1963862 RepID=UPI0029C6C026|nr:hypothetical protein [Marispirochaeta aestuarii]
MKEFVIEYELNKVRSNNTKRYLEEVINNYNVGSYRSAIVALYSVVIYDVLEKINILSEIYEDQASTDIKNRVEQSQKENPNSPKWEKLLIEMVFERTELLNAVEKKKIDHLFDDRNYCAHPLYDNKFELINPNREQVRAHIRNMMECSFQKDALLSKKIINDFLSDTNDYYSKMGTQGLDKYIKNKYLIRFNDITYREVFKTLWKLVFIIENDDCDKNRTSNFETISIMIANRKNVCINAIRDEPDYYNNLKPSNNDLDYDKYYDPGENRIISLVYLFFYFPEMIELFNDANIATVGHVSDANLNLKFIAFYNSENINEHFNIVSQQIDNICHGDNGWFYVEKYTVLNGDLVEKTISRFQELDACDALNSFIIDYYTYSPTYDSAKHIFYSIVRHFLPIFTIEEYRILLEKMNENDQIFKSRDYRYIRDEIDHELSIRFQNRIDINSYANL